MTDTVTSEVRSRIMSSVPQRNTSAERIVRSCLHRLGYRFRVYRRDLPGSPDIVLPRYQTAIFVHGCFWHQHRHCPKARRPSSNTNYWDRKLSENVVRDKLKAKQLMKLGWRVVVVWECETRKLESLVERLLKLLG